MVKLDDEIAKTILRKIYRAGQVKEDDVPKGMPRRLAGDVKEVLKELHRKKYVYAVKTRDEIAFKINRARIRDVEKIIRDPY